MHADIAMSVDVIDELKLESGLQSVLRDNSRLSAWMFIDNFYQFEILILGGELAKWYCNFVSLVVKFVGWN